MKFKYFFIVLLTKCLADISVKPFDKVELCPPEKDKLVKVMTLGGNIEGSLKKDPEVDDPFLASACYKEIEDDSKETLTEFYTSMKNGSEVFRTLFTGWEVQKRNHVYQAGLELQNLGWKMLTFEDLLRKSFETGNFTFVEKYAKEQRKQAEAYYERYLFYMNHFQGKPHRKESTVKMTIHKYCSPGIKRIEHIGENFENCLQRRINETKSDPTFKKNKKCPKENKNKNKNV